MVSPSFSGAKVRFFIEKALFSQKKGRNVCKFRKKPYLCIAFEKKASQKEFGEVAEWSIAAVLKTVVLRGTRGSNPCLSAN